MLWECKWCGLQGEAEEFEWDREGRGFWCPDCDGYTYRDPKDEPGRRMLLYLETGGAGTEQPAPRTGLRKRLSPLRYPGGKSRMIDTLYAALSKDHMETFVELFAGGASLGLSLLDAGAIRHLVLNDLDPLVHNFWRCVLDSPDYLLSRLRGPAPTLKDYIEAKTAVTDPDALDRYTGSYLAWAFFLVNRMSFGGIQTAGPLGGYHGDGSKLLSRFPAVELARRIVRIGEMRDSITLRHADASELLWFGDEWWGPETTLFVDPPYIGQGDRLYPARMSMQAHRDLAAILNQLYISFPSPDIILTYDDCPEVRDLYPYAQVRTLPRAYSLTPPLKRAE